VKGRRREWTGEEGKGMGDPPYVSLHFPMRLSGSHNISKRVKMTLHHSIVVYM